MFDKIFWCISFIKAMEKSFDEKGDFMAFIAIWGKIRFTNNVWIKFDDILNVNFDECDESGIDLCVIRLKILKYDANDW